MEQCKIQTSHNISFHDEMVVSFIKKDNHKLKAVVNIHQIINAKNLKQRYHTIIISPRTEEIVEF